MKKPIVNVVLRTGLLVGCVWLLSRAVDLPAVTRHLGMLSLPVLAFAIVLAVVHQGLAGIRWMWLNPDPTGQWHIFDYFRYTMISNAFNIVMPGALGGDVVRSIYVFKDAESHRADNLVGMLIDRVVGLFSILAMGVVCAMVAPGLNDRSTFVWGMGLVLLAMLVGGGLSVYGPMNRWLAGMLERWGNLGGRLASLVRTWAGVTEFYAMNRLRVAAALLLCFVMHLLWFYVVYLLARDLDMQVGYLGLSMISAISLLITAVPLTFGGLGIREISFVVLLGTQGIGAEPATALSFSQFVVSLVIAVLGLPFIWMSKRGNPVAVRTA